jgi:ElaB/YqjD/DUF883 family membrane-anchored ribosome-binding protein
MTKENHMDTTALGTSASITGASDKVDGTLNKVSAGAHAAVDSIAGAASEASRNVKPAIDHVAEMAHRAVDKAAGAAAPTADWLADQGDSLNAAQKKLISDTCNYVSANPLQSVGIALVAGILISRMMR